MSRPRLLDLFCCEGGAAEGYTRAGFTVVGVDVESQPRYRDLFVQEDALMVLRRLLDGHGVMFGSPSDGHDVSAIRMYGLEDFDAIHASPPCQLYSKTHRINSSDFPDLIEPTRQLLLETGLPYIIENVEDARGELKQPKMLCGAVFGLQTYRHRLFETNWGFREPGHPPHLAKTTKMGRAPVDGEYMHVVGNFSGVDRARRIMDMPWASRRGLAEAIPPAYTEFIGAQLIEALAVTV